MQLHFRIVFTMKQNELQLLAEYLKLGGYIASIPESIISNQKVFLLSPTLYLDLDFYFLP